MEKKIILIVALILFGRCFSFNKTDSYEKVMNFYNHNRDVDFEIFKCFVILQWNQNRKNRRDEYLVEFYPNCQMENHAPLRGKVKFQNGIPIFHSEGLKEDDLPLEILKRFHELNVSNLFYKKPNELELTIYPDIRIVKSCGITKPGYLNIDSCWKYKIRNH